ncbi:MAG TPA: LapA family protein [Alphaproteobacteria bacterium]|nr:LapA family protein [Alphaproteobacteria bacterium]
MKPLKLIGWGILVIVALIAVVFAIHNHGAQTVNFWPLPYALSAPLYAVVITALAAGFVLGAAASWIGGRGWRKLARQRRRENDALMRELDGFKANERARALAAPGSGGSGQAAIPARALVGKGG